MNYKLIVEASEFDPSRIDDTEAQIRKQAQSTKLNRFNCDA